MTSIGLVFLTTRELIQLITNPKKYFQSFENFLEATIIILTATTIGLLSYDKDLAIHTGAWALFLGWWELALLIGRFPVFGIYIYLSVGVLQTLMIFFLVYLPVLIAFTLIFHLLLPSTDAFTNPGTSLLKVMAMMIGELEYGSYFLPGYICFSNSYFFSLVFALSCIFNSTNI